MAFRPPSGGGITYIVGDGLEEIGNTLQVKAGSGLGFDVSGALEVISSGVVAWGGITGTLSNQTDLQNALNAKADAASLATVATSGLYSDLSGTPSLATVATTGDYDDLINKPTIPAVPGTKNSVEVDAGDYQLVGDAASPGNLKYYGTNGSGTKGFHDIPTGGTVNWGDIGGTLSAQTDLQNALNAKADTSSLAAVATSGDYADILNTPSLAGFLVASNNLSDLTNASTARTNLGLVIGTNVQAYSATLDSWASKSVPTGDVVGTTDFQILTNKFLTSPILTDAIIQGSINFSFEPFIGNSGSSFNVDWSTANRQWVVLNQDNVDVTFTNPAGATTLILRVVQDATGNRQLNLPAGTRTPGGLPLPIALASNAVTLIHLYFDSSSVYYATSSVDFLPL